MALEWWGTVRWVGHRFSYLSPTTWSGFGLGSGFGYLRQLRWDPYSFNGVVDEFLWSLITAFESVALVSMLCCFFLFCGCNF